MISFMKNLTNSQLAYHGLRIAFGLSFMVHGAVRFPDLAGFATKMSGQFEATILAGFPALTFAYIIPVAETLIGLALLIGCKFVRWGAFAGCLLMAGIMFGTCMLQKWELLASQLLHLYLFYIILNNPNTADVAEKPA